MNTHILIYPILHKRLASLELSRFNLRIFWILASILIIASFIFYIFQINAVLSDGYLIQNYEKKLESTLEENKKLEKVLAQANSLENIEKLVKNLNFEKTEKIYYIRVLEGKVVRRPAAINNE